MGQTLPNGDGVVEFVGLSERTPQSLRKAFGGTADGEAVHYCAANLIQDLKMAEAAVVYFRQESGEDYILVSVVEPGNRDRVVYRPEQRGPSRPIESFVDLAECLKKRDLGTQLAVLNSARLAKLDLDAALRAIAAPEDSVATVNKVWQELLDCRSDAYFQRALWALGHDPDPADRVAATVILSNFHDRDLSWWALADGLRDADPTVRGMCGQVLYSLTRYAPRRIDWAPAAPSLRHVLAGTNLFALSHVIQMLVATEVSSELAGTLIGDNGDLVMGYFAASHEPVRKQAHALLRQLRGEDLGTKFEPWQQWVTTLGSE